MPSTLIYFDSTRKALNLAEKSIFVQNALLVLQIQHAAVLLYFLLFKLVDLRLLFVFVLILISSFLRHFFPLFAVFDTTSEQPLQFNL